MVYASQHPPIAMKQLAIESTATWITSVGQKYRAWWSSWRKRPHPSSSSFNIIILIIVYYHHPSASLIMVLHVSEHPPTSSWRRPPSCSRTASMANLPMASQSRLLLHHPRWQGSQVFTVTGCTWSKSQLMQELQLSEHWICPTLEHVGQHPHQTESGCPPVSQHRRCIHHVSRSLQVEVWEPCKTFLQTKLCMWIQLSTTTPLQSQQSLPWQMEEFVETLERFKKNRKALHSASTLLV